MSTPAEHTSFQFAEINKLSKQLEQMRSWGVSVIDPGYLRLDSALSGAIARSTAYLAFGSHEKAYTLAVIDFFGYFALKRGIKPKDD